MFRTSIAVLLFLVTGVSIADTGKGVDPQLITPGSTILAYCKSNVFDLHSKYFHFPESRIGDAEVTLLDWSKCRIKDIRKTNLAGHSYDGTLVKSTDVEVILEIVELDKNPTSKPTDYWFLLRRYPIGWRIYSYSVIGYE